MRRYFTDVFLAASGIAIILTAGFIAELLLPIAMHALKLG